MKKNTTITILAVAMALAGIQQAQAGDKEKYLLGGLLGGWILNEVASHSVETRSRACSPVVVERHHSHYNRPSGRYEYRQVREWIPGCYIRERGRCGRSEYRWVPGHYSYRTEKVWVSYGSSRSRRYSHCR